jgi:hypothetical protein
MPFEAEKFIDIKTHVTKNKTLKFQERERGKREINSKRNSNTLEAPAVLF